MPYKKLDEYEPHQRGIVSAGSKKRGNSLFRDGDFAEEPCPRCGCIMRVQRKKTGAIRFWCPCGHLEYPAHRGDDW